MSEYVYFCNSFTTNPAVADAFAGIVGNEPGDAQAFTNGVKLRQVGDNTNTVAAYGVAVPMKATGAGFVNEFNSDGPYPTFTALGVSEEQIAFAKTVLFVEVGEREILRTASEFWAEHDLEPITITFGW